MSRVSRLIGGCAALALGSLALGAIVAPRSLAENYGLPTEDSRALAFVRATGARDGILGLMIASALGEPKRLSMTLGLTALVGASDLAIVAGAGRLDALRLTIHGGGTLGLLMAAFIARTGA